jgi:hypothetical protein
VASNPAALARAAIPSVGLEEIWAQQPGEPDAAYGAFLEWLDAGASRKSPATADIPAAHKYNWAQRAIAYERAHEIHRADVTGVPAAVQITDSLTRMVQIEARKLLRKSAAETDPVISVGDLMRVVGFLAENGHTGKPVKTKQDYSNLSIEDLRALRLADEIKQRLNR